MRTGWRCVFLVAFVFLPASLALPFGTLHAQDLFEVNVHAAVLRLPELAETPAGVGVGFSYAALFPLIAIDAELNHFPTSASGNFGATQGLFGLRAGFRVRKLGIFARLRPGFIQFEDGAAEDRLTSRTQFDLDVGGGFEYDIVPHIAVRVDLGEEIIPFGSAMLLAGPGVVDVPFGTQHNFEAEAGAVVHF